MTLQNQYGPGRGQIWLDEVECIGYESTIAECQHNPWGYHNCGHGQDVSISCNSLNDSKFLSYLSNNNNNSNNN